LDESGADDLHVARQHDEVDLALFQPVAEYAVAQLAVAAVVGRIEHPGLHAGLLRTPQPPRVRAVRAHGDHLDPVAPVDLVEDRLEVGTLPGDQYGDSVA